MIFPWWICPLFITGIITSVIAFVWCKATEYKALGFWGDLLVPLVLLSPWIVCVLYVAGSFIVRVFILIWTKP